jgi:hypothetical protein
MKVYAILNAEKVCINRIVWDGESNWQPPEGCVAIEDSEGIYPIYRKSGAEETL